MADQLYGITLGQAETIAQGIRDSQTALSRVNNAQGRDQIPGENVIKPCKIVLDVDGNGDPTGNPGGATPTDACTFTYKVLTLDGAQTLITGATPKKPGRVVGLRYLPGNQFGEVTILDGKIELWNAFEVPDFQPCNTPPPAAAAPAARLPWPLSILQRRGGNA